MPGVPLDILVARLVREQRQRLLLDRVAGVPMPEPPLIRIVVEDAPGGCRSIRTYDPVQGKLVDRGLLVAVEAVSSQVRRLKEHLGKQGHRVEVLER